MAPASSFTVPVLSIAGYREITDIRVVVESLAVERATPLLTKRDLDELHAINERFKDARRRALVREPGGLRRNLVDMGDDDVGAVDDGLADQTGRLVRIQPRQGGEQQIVIVRIREPVRLDWKQVVQAGPDLEPKRLDHGRERRHARTAVKHQPEFLVLMERLG